MDRWKYVSANGRKESGFENLKTRLQSFKKAGKQTVIQSGKQTVCKENKLSLWNE